jgi:hypothetical protein
MAFLVDAGDPGGRVNETVHMAYINIAGAVSAGDFSKEGCPA